MAGEGDSLVPNSWVVEFADAEITGPAQGTAACPDCRGTGKIYACSSPRQRLLWLNVPRADHVAEIGAIDELHDEEVQPVALAEVVTLRQVACFLDRPSGAAEKCVDRIPVCLAKNRQRLARLIPGASARRQHDAPPGGLESGMGRSSVMSDVIVFFRGHAGMLTLQRYISSTYTCH